MKINLSTYHKWPYMRQLPAHKNTWGEYDFNGHKHSDFLVVYDEPHKAIKTNIPRARRFLFISEPPSIKQYAPEFLNQFGIIITPQEILNLDPAVTQIISQLSLPWHYGVAHSHRFMNYKTYDDLKSAEAPAKISEVSTMISSKMMNAHHRQRIETTKLLKEKLGKRFHLLGRGHKEVDDKAEGIDPYAFHLVCENNDIPHFWTEKLSDAYLGWAFPIFSGCPNIGDYFPKDSYLTVDLSDPEATLNTIQACLNEPDFYQKRLPAIKEARELILDKYNLFAYIHDIINQKEWDMTATLSKAEYVQPQTPQRNIIQRAVQKALTFGFKVIRRLKNLPFLLPYYFKLVNKNPNFFTDYHDRLGKEALTNGYYGQRGQDWYLDQKIFDGKKNGVFLDVGANDPKELSNSLYFEEKGWTGLAFEPQERFRNKWKTDRKTKCLPHLLGANDNEEVAFLEYDTDDWQNALSGVQGYVLESGVNIDHIDKKITKLKKRRLDKILEEENILHADFMSLDVEGFEMEVLQGIDFDKVKIDVIIIENDRSHLGDNKIRKFIKSKGYKHIARLSGDDIFQRIGANL